MFYRVSDSYRTSKPGFEGLMDFVSAKQEKKNENKEHVERHQTQFLSMRSLCPYHRVILSKALRIKFTRK